MKFLSTLVLVLPLISSSYATAILENIAVNILDPTKGKCTITINPTVPKTVDIDVESYIEAKDITVRRKFGKYLILIPCLFSLNSPHFH